ncbi:MULTISPECIES: tyrosine-type recombinase/integrase [unclassified Acinetobacter]|uniref:tyrosine-type recombinase/integrase n=1 Tax=unclassified Acinetobacter TaxID=196816 RepID=UPI0029342D67|nr:MULTISPECIES: tyrosine-type recombinase/integrase [unclassified Acinetobacter]WOE32227.1 tyrosine-type recombinase/integrase [Acinetobacter sp. SAAs470]WOE37697.1 tyrosine-type recombinase/integrase [Acinetobacter sp. SAAs474]
MLTESYLKKAKPRDKTYQLSFGDGLSFVVDPTGLKYWKLRYYDINGKRKVKRLGVYPEINTRNILVERVNFLDTLQHAAQYQKIMTFSDVAAEWLAFKKKNSFGDYPLSGVLVLAEKCIKNDFEPLIGNIAFAELKRTDLVKVIRNIENRQVKEPCKKACSYLSQIFDYGLSVGYIDLNIATGLNKILVKTKMKKNYAFLNHTEIKQFYQQLKTANCHPIIRKALQIKTLTGVRGTELLNAKMNDIDLNQKLWRIPAIQVKQLRRKVIEGQKIPDYLIPLSNEAIEVISSAIEWSYGSEYIFSSPIHKNQRLHFNSLNNAIRRMGYSTDQLTSHGLRSSMSTVLNESNLFKSEWIEAQLSHADKNTVRGTYNHADYLDHRSKMMQWWADFLNHSTI